MSQDKLPDACTKAGLTAKDRATALRVWHALIPDDQLEDRDMYADVEQLLDAHARDAEHKAMLVCAELTCDLCALHVKLEEVENTKVFGHRVREARYGDLGLEQCKARSIVTNLARKETP